MSAANVAVLRAKLSRERRTNRRLRSLIEDIREELHNTRHDIDVQTKRIAQLQAEVDRLKAEGRR